MRNTKETTNKRIFLFVTGRCTRSCEYCFMANSHYSADMSEEIRCRALDIAHGNNYPAITLIGGEPLLYPDLLKCIDEINERGLLCSISTAGTDDKALLDAVLSKPIDDITVSLDSADEETNDQLRGAGAFRRAIDMIDAAINAGIDVRVTTTVNRNNMKGIPKLIDFLESKGVFQLDLHLMSFNGRAKNHPELGLKPWEWVRLRDRIIDQKTTGIALSVPYIWIDKQNELFSTYSHYCEMCDGERMSIMPNGDVFTCTLAIGEEPPCGSVFTWPIPLTNKDYVFDTKGLCRCERNIGTTVSRSYAYICRFVKHKKV